MNSLAGLGMRRRRKMRTKTTEVPELKTEFNYNRLWKMLIDRGMKKQDLQKLSHVSAASIAKMGRCENVTTDILLRICEALDCDVQDIMERVEK
jgi:DNA-binding Xre family transcriptional regulator